MTEAERLIVVGVDGSGPGQVALERAIAEARMWDADLHVVYVADVPPVALYLTDTVPIDMTELARIQREGVWEVVEPVIEAAACSVERVDLDGYPADRLVEYCEGAGADLLILGAAAGWQRPSSDPPA